MSAQELSDRAVNAAGRCLRGAEGWDDARRPGSMSARTSAQAGFTLIELMVVVIVIGILAAIAIPNYISLKRRAEEGAVKANMHTLQVSVEDYSVMNDGDYPTAASSTLSDGRNLSQVCPTGNYPSNPYTHVPSVVQFNADPTTGLAGEMALNPALTSSYLVRGNGWDGSPLALSLTSGQ